MGKIRSIKDICQERLSKYEGYKGLFYSLHSASDDDGYMEMGPIFRTDSAIYLADISDTIQSVMRVCFEKGLIEFADFSPRIVAHQEDLYFVLPVDTGSDG